MLAVGEWFGENRRHYESFLTTDNFDNDIEHFKQQGYFTRELGNLMVLALANVLKIPIVIFSSLENYPTIPVLPRQQLNDMPTLFISFNTAGCGHYDYVYMESIQSVQETRQGKKKVEEKQHDVSCSCGISRKGKGSLPNICNNIIRSYSIRCNRLKA